MKGRWNGAWHLMLYPFKIWLKNWHLIRYNLRFIDVAECQSGSHSYHAQAHCVNIQGSYECRCLSGYLGDGRATCAGNFEINHAKKHHTTVFYSRRHRQETMSWESLSSIDAPLLMITSKTWSEGPVILSGYFGQNHVQTDGVAFLI